MNLLKSIFISAYMMMIMGIAGYSGWMLYQGADRLAWLGTLLTVAPILSVISWLMMFKNVARTSAHFPLINLLGATGVALAGWAWLEHGAGIPALALAAGAWVAFLTYSFWFSTFGGRAPSMRLVAGANLPEFKVKNAEGKLVSSAHFTGRPTILIFYRGNWCPFCMAQLKELAERYEEIRRLGVRVAMISPQPHANTVQIAKKFRIDLSFEFLTDEGNAAARSLGILNLHGTPMGMQALGYDSDTVLPTVVITDKDGRIIWTHETDNYRVRPEPATYLDVMRRQGIVAAKA